MITRLSHVTFFVLDQDKAYDFYVNKLGFKVNTDASMPTYEELKGKGVHFRSEPQEQFYGTEAVVTDGNGNWFSMTQRK